MRILMISDVYFPRINGVSTSIETFRRGLHAIGCETVLLAPAYPTRRSQEADIIRIPSRYLPRDPEDRIMKPSAIRKLHAQLAARRFDLVHIQTPFIAHYAGVDLARRLGAPVIESYHTYFEEYLHHYVPLAPRRLMRFVARRFTVSQCNALDALVAPSRAMESALRDYGVRCPIQIIPTGLEPDRFVGGDGVRFRQQLGIEPTAPTLVHVGRIAHEKNIDFLVRMFAKVAALRRDAVMIIAGEGPALAHCKAHVRALGVERQVRFVGYLSRDKDLLECYRAGDLFVFSSKTETQGLVLLEALALGVPVVSLAHMGAAEIVNARRGATPAPDNENAFAQLVLELLDNPARRASLASDARSYAAEWSARAMAEKLAALYAQVRKDFLARTQLRNPSAALPV